MRRSHMAAVALAAAAAVCGLAGCTKDEGEIEKGKLSVLEKEKPEDVTELSVLYTGENIGWTAAMEELCEEFTSGHPGISIVRRFRL